jgi:hypothetical protein
VPPLYGFIDAWRILAPKHLSLSLFLAQKKIGLSPIALKEVWEPGFFFAHSCIEVSLKYKKKSYKMFKNNYLIHYLYSSYVGRNSHLVTKLTHADQSINRKTIGEIMHPESKKLLDQVRETIRLKHYSRKTEKQGRIDKFF